MMGVKEILLQVAETLPSDATLADAINELRFRQAVEDGIASLDSGARVPLEDARRKISKWTASLRS
jgi:hypothetical protein